MTLAGDGIGPEVMAEAERVLEALPLELELDARPFGGAAIDAAGHPLPPETLAACKSADAVLLAAIGGPRYDSAAVRPEAGLLSLRSALQTFANLRPARDGEEVDMLVVRELVGGLYFGTRGRRDDGSAFDTCEYAPHEIERVARSAFELARARRRHVTSVDKANVLETSRLWREVVEAVAADYDDVALEHMYVDNAAMQIASHADQFDVLLTENMMGDILSDLAAAVTGGLGLAASASLGDGGPGIFEPVHGSAPDIAGQGVANPAAMLRTVALMLAHGIGKPEQGARVEAAVDGALHEAPTRDQGGTASTREFGDAVLAALGA